MHNFIMVTILFIVLKLTSSLILSWWWILLALTVDTLYSSQDIEKAMKIVSLEKSLSIRSDYLSSLKKNKIFSLVCLWRVRR